MMRGKLILYILQLNDILVLQHLIYAI